MFYIDNIMCTGCGYCVDACPQGAITIENNVAFIHQELCTRCNSCAEVCLVGAIRELAPAYLKTVKGGETMTYGYGRGFGFRGASPAWPYVGRGRGGLPRCWYPGIMGGTAKPNIGREQELDMLKNQAQAMREQLEQLEARMKQLDNEA